MPPLRAGLAVGLSMFVAADQGFNTVAGLTPSPTQFPLVTHARAFASHVAYGVALGLLLAA